ncbi:MAG TPA: DUF362 domain-containing protein [Candidatus Hydrogenedentes bacterium]|nr:DUF362 domain-containing protein [Candidatus Hydrogenedentota bacterium]
MTNADSLSRRSFLQNSLYGIAAGTFLMHTARAQTPATRITLTYGDSRAKNVYDALKLIESQIREGLAKKRTIVIKPNLVNIDNQLTATHVDCLEGILEFLKPLVQDEIIITESPANGPAAEGYSNYGYLRLKDKFNIRFVDLDAEPFGTEYLVNERHHVIPVRFSKLILDPNIYLISTAPMKTHDRAVVTLGLKNIAAGAIIKDSGYRWGPNSKGTTDKHLIHGGPKNEGIHFNMFSLAKRVTPQLTVLDGFQSMEHNGPVSGTPVDHKIALAGTDWLAVDRMAAELMGFDYNKIGYMVFCAKAGMGEVDKSKIEILGARFDDHIRHYQPHDAIEQQYKWM